MQFQAKRLQLQNAQNCRSIQIESYLFLQSLRYLLLDHIVAWKFPLHVQLSILPCV